MEWRAIGVYSLFARETIALHAEKDDSECSGEAEN